MKASRLTIATSLFSLLFIGFLISANAQSTRIEKEYNEVFPAVAGGELHISNKYGEVIINTWEEDSVQVIASIVSQGKSSYEVQESIERIRISLNQSGSSIWASTNIEKGGKGLFKELMSEVEKGLSGGNNVRVNYEVWLPADFPIFIDHKYGSIYAPDLQGKVKIDLSHGDFRAHSLAGVLTLNQGYGKCDIEKLNRAEMTLKGVTADIRNASDLKIQSSSSELTFGTLQKLQIESRNDEIYAKEVVSVVADGSFSDFTTEMLTKGGNFDFNYGDLYVRRIAYDFESLTILGKSADVNLVLDQASYTLAEIKGDQEKMIVPNSMLTLSKGTDPNTDQVILSGYVGNTHQKFSKLNIDCKGGEMVIAIKELPLYSDRD